ncbi:tetratricopeptide repeat protein [Desulfobacter postgatei]|uniref:tetratricopeptide repeat protein n=1 Tax=Desulfobacter TaxID=2289 RepID=UPI002A35AE95|nr:tetratricopeptide repeat protein [Desulfobacter postgatei]MDX9963504.1 tetratricopeptide repeat protein [Desulfobacter postgatei]
MPHKQKKCLISMLKDIGFLNRTAMAAGNAGKFDTAFKNMNQALDLTRNLKKKCLMAKLLNNLGNLYTMSEEWDKALLAYEQSMSIVTEHYGTDNILFKTLQKNLVYLLTLDIAAA